VSGPKPNHSGQLRGVNAPGNSSRSDCRAASAMIPSRTALVYLALDSASPASRAIIVTSARGTSSGIPVNSCSLAGSRTAKISNRPSASSPCAPRTPAPASTLVSHCASSNTHASGCPSCRLRQQGSNTAPRPEAIRGLARGKAERCAKRVPVADRQCASSRPSIGASQLLDPRTQAPLGLHSARGPRGTPTPLPPPRYSRSAVSRRRRPHRVTQYPALTGPNTIEHSSRAPHSGRRSRGAILVHPA